ncbi:hypothetical protein DTQ80_14620 [Listeria monocytogenes]|uniref:hypothetical protein n=1 Tax=Listeria monocytogenes TaxID=1639 RepID=UPI00077568D4|nr:hypothetical protein [Listeria monocytogenes]EAC8225591.1 hypothetical protein [Listeria monocytogenes]EAC8234962.1 hypothetical protein [Listeria monocytogenes]EAC8603962.1 hypothetical protein [Listeria monocytogenes]EAC9724671.1 hypothetical protein [Listeria monocytogenes]EAD0080822.1 hypothetical protein [Listeria monocytogenes]
MSGRKILRVPSEVNAKQKWTKLQVKDGFIIIGSIGIGYILSLPLPLHAIIAPFFVGAFPVSLYFLLLPNGEVPQKKNYQVMLTVIRKRHIVYHRESRKDLEGRRNG